MTLEDTAMASIRKLTIELLMSSHISKNGRAPVIWRKLWWQSRGCGLLRFTCWNIGERAFELKA